MNAAALGPVCRPVGLETEFGVLRPGDAWANPVALASQIVAAYGEISRPELAESAAAVRWDYEGEDPLADLRGGRLDRAAAHPSQLTDNPAQLAPAVDVDLPPAPWQPRPRPTAAEASLARATTAVLPNGARLYVDHAHPEYSSPECLTPEQALLWDRAGETVARAAMDAVFAGRGGVPAGESIVLYKNNVDGKGAAYGSHENYLVRRELPFETLSAAMIPFLVTRPVFAGAGRVGIGQRSERPGFQISQRADYVENNVGLETTFNRPIVNTRDEPHADTDRFRRFHIINGDANRFDTPIYLKIASTQLLLWCLERAHARDLPLTEIEQLSLTRDPVEEGWALSHDTTLSYRLETRQGALTGLEIQRSFWQLIARALTEDFGGLAAEHVGTDTAAAMALWDETLTALEQLESAPAAAAKLVEWVAKLQLCQGLASRSEQGWADPKLAALDIQWADLRTQNSLIGKLDAAGRIHRIVTEAQVAQAASQPPAGTRAAVRGQAVAQLAEVVAASWTSLVLDIPGEQNLLRVALSDSVSMTADETVHAMDALHALVNAERN